jgi:sugar lactone lactonase YvrE
MLLSLTIHSVRSFALGFGVLLGALSAAGQSLTVTTVTTQFAGAGIAVDPTGNLFVTGDYAVRKIAPQGTVTTFAGMVGMPGRAGADLANDGTGTAARFIRPAAIARDSAGTLYVADANFVRRITTTGVVTSSSGWAFNGGVSALAVGPGNILYVASYTTVRKALSNGSDVIIAGSADNRSPDDLVAKDGSAATARFGPISGLAVDTAGNIYVADQGNHTIRKITPSGVVTTLAGVTGGAGYADGTGAAARFNSPSGIVVDGAGNLYVTDTNNNSIRRITSAGVVTTVVGGPGLPPILDASGRALFPDGVGAAARLNGPGALAIDSAGTLYFADGVGIRKAANIPAVAKVAVSPQNQTAPWGQRTTFSIVASGNPAVSYRWQRQTSAAAGWSDLADGPNFSGATTAVLTVSNLVTAMNGNQFRCVVTNTVGTDTSAPASLTVDLPVVTMALDVSTLAGEPGRVGPSRGDTIDATGRAARFIFPQGVTCDAAGNVYVAESAGNRIRRITPAGVVTTLAGSGTAGAADGTGTAAQFNGPAAAAVDTNGNMIVADTMNGAIRKITPAGAVTTFAGVDSVGNPARFARPIGLVFDARGELMVIEATLRGAVDIITPAGLVSSWALVRPDANGVFPTILPESSAVATDGRGKLYFTHAVHHTIGRWTRSTGQWSFVAGQWGIAGSRDGSAANARFDSPSGIAVDAAGNLYISDTGNSCIRKITPAGLVSTVAGRAAFVGEASSAGTSDGIGSAARFNQPRGLAIDRAGNLYIADSLNNAIRKARLPAESVPGGPVILAVNGGDAASYQWLKDGNPIAGATRGELMIADIAESDSGQYSVRLAMRTGDTDVTEPFKLSIGAGATPPPTDTSPPVVTPPPVVLAPASRIVNLSIRASVGSSDSALTVGFVVNGNGMPLLVRGVGPGLAGFGVDSPLSSPKLALYNGQRTIGVNEKWDGAADIAAAAARLGAFALAVNSLDTALLTTVDSGAFTVQCTAANDASGTALVEVYDAGSAASCRLVNVSARSQVRGNEEVMIAGFSISGTTPRRVLIRAIGPGLRQFGVTDALADPELRVVAASENRVVASNNDWSGTSALDVAFASVGAFSLVNDSHDAALLESLAPGTYSVVVSGVANGSGEALVEIYELP